MAGSEPTVVNPAWWRGIPSRGIAGTPSREQSGIDQLPGASHPVGIVWVDELGDVLAERLMRPTSACLRYSIDRAAWLACVTRRSWVPLMSSST